MSRKTSSVKNPGRKAWVFLLLYSAGISKEREKEGGCSAGSSRRKERISSAICWSSDEAAGAEIGDWRLEIGEGLATTVAERGRGRRETKKISRVAKTKIGRTIQTTRGGFMAVGEGDWRPQVTVGGAV